MDNDKPDGPIQKQALQQSASALKQHKQVKQQTDLLLLLLHPESQR